MVEEFDVVVIGSGPAGRQAAVDLNSAGLSVAVVEDYGFGGTCPLRGCEPKKLLVDASTTTARVRDMLGHGLDGGVSINWPELMRYNRGFVDPTSDRVEVWLDHEGIATFFGKARFIGPDTVDTGSETLRGKHLVLATGAVARPIDIPGKEHVALSDHFLEMTAMPERIVFMGGGFISFELGHLAARVGAKVTILEVMDRPLLPFEPDLVKLLVAATEEAGIELVLSCPVQSVEKRDGTYMVHAGTDGGQAFEADLVVHGAGRVPATAGLDLETGGVEYTPRGITVNDFLQSVSNPKVYAAGDVAFTTLPLTPVATMEGAVAAHNILSGNKKTSPRENVPSAVFTYPPLATIGLKEADAEKQGLRFKTYFKETARWSEHQRIGMKHAGFKILVDEETDRIIGAHLLGERAEEMINAFALAMQHGLTVSQLKQTVWAYPSFLYALRYVLP